MVPDYAFSAALSTTDDFDPCPPWFFYIGTGFLLTSGIFPLGLFCIWCKSPKGMNTTYKALYTLMIFYSFCMHLTACSSLPVFIFPYRIAVITTGIATSFGPSTNFLFSLLFMFGCSIPCTNASLFYYRTDALLPPDHRWNKKCIRRTFYSLILTTYVPIFFILYVEGSTDQELQKKEAFQDLGYVTKYLWDARTVIYNISLDHSFIYILVGSIVIFLGFPSFMTIGLFFNYVYILTRFNKNASKRTARLHSILFITLVAQITVYGLLFVGPIVFFLVCVYFNLGNNFIIQLATSVFAMSPVGGVFTMIAVNQHYRRYLIQLFVKEKKVAPIKRTSVSTVILKI